MVRVELRGGLILIELSRDLLIDVNKNSSRGNQLKWKIDDTWYKIDYLGYESLAEYDVSTLLGKTNVSNFVKYKLESVVYNKRGRIGCRSKNFLREGECLLTLPRLFNAFAGEDIYAECDRLDRTETDCLQYVVAGAEQITGLANFGQYLTMMLEMDALFLNEDRHFHNIAVIFDRLINQFRLCPIFDNGGSLFSDVTLSYPLVDSIDKCMGRITAKPFSPCFEDQVKAAEDLYGKQFEFWFSNKDVVDVLDNAVGFYGVDVLERVGHVLIEQIQKYSYLQKTAPEQSALFIHTTILE